jgi:Ca2+-binding RTX toxin-like protein
VELDFAAGTASTDADSLTLESIEGALGTRFDDSLFGDGRHNEFFGLGGSDLIHGRAGFDYSRYDSSSRRIRANLAEGVATGEGTDELISINALVGSRNNDVLVGDRVVNWIYGGRGNDLLLGGDGADTLFGGADDDALVGEEGNDDLFGGTGEDVCDQGRGRGRERSCVSV